MTGTNRGHANRMSGTRFDYRSSWLGNPGRWLAGDWWQIEGLRHQYGVWHPWRWHVWENYRFTLVGAQRERDRRNSGRHYEICSVCNCTCESHSEQHPKSIACPAYRP